MHSVAVVTVSDRCAREGKQDESSPAVLGVIGEQGKEVGGGQAPWKVVCKWLVPDERECIRAALWRACGRRADARTEQHLRECGDCWRQWNEVVEDVDTEPARLVLTVGGTGLAARDITPEVVLEVCDGRQAWGIAHLAMNISLRHTPLAAASRMVAGIAGGSTLIFTLPGSPRVARQILPELLPVLAHASDTLRGTSSHA
ncbi:hypothetical protein CDCA_CDCA06G1780 [Cyanidium caldarium]|uniref:MoaB/Mog domain-containing protein n=1 Tax=Cyanidium caldarium TaxID=2771 RepID=A0AAV9IUG1_CYACA|nr:hypothetical protein CDCA_CDCA06G1780 [Cyanidium caldarium]|eukprot:ctg_281.g169